MTFEKAFRELHDAQMEFDKVLRDAHRSSVTKQFAMNALQSATNMTWDRCWALSNLLHPLKGPSPYDGDIQSIIAESANNEISSRSIDKDESLRQTIITWIEKQPPTQIKASSKPRKPQGPRDARKSRKPRKTPIIQAKDPKYQVRKARSPKLRREGAITRSMGRQLQRASGREACSR